METPMIGSYASILLLGTSLTVMVADGVPKLDVGPSCKAAALVPPGNMKSCLRDERAAQKTLAASWATFASGDRTTCTKDAGIGGLSSYVALLTCLQMARDAGKLSPGQKL
jgi:hypothetical protein